MFLRFIHHELKRQLKIKVGKLKLCLCFLACGCCTVLCVWCVYARKKRHNNHYPVWPFYWTASLTIQINTIMLGNFPCCWEPDVTFNKLQTLLTLYNDAYIMSLHHTTMKQRQHSLLKCLRVSIIKDTQLRRNNMITYVKANEPKTTSTYVQQRTSTLYNFSTIWKSYWF